MAGYGGIRAIAASNEVVSSKLVARHLKALERRQPDVFLVPSLLEDIVDSLGLENATVCSSLISMISNRSTQRLP